MRRRSAGRERRTRPGRPFVGAAGQLLTKILAAIDFKREDVFICNVLKHRPPGNRNPLPDEVMACSPYLVRQIELVRPKVILALGTFAAQTLLDTKLRSASCAARFTAITACRSSSPITPPRFSGIRPGSAPPGKMSSSPVEYSIAPHRRGVTRTAIAVLHTRRTPSRRCSSAMLIDQDAVLRAVEHRRRHDVLRRAPSPDLPRDGRRSPSAAASSIRSRSPTSCSGAASSKASGGKDYIGFLVDAVPTAANVEYHAQIVREKAILRRLIEVSTAIVAEAFEATVDRARAARRSRVEDLPGQPAADATTASRASRSCSGRRWSASRRSSAAARRSPASRAASTISTR